MASRTELYEQHAKACDLALVGGPEERYAAPGPLRAFATDLRRTFSMPGSPTIDFPTRDGNRGGS